jgi:hypothetical protein
LWIAIDEHGRAIGATQGQHQHDREGGFAGAAFSVTKRDGH